MHANIADKPVVWRLASALKLSHAKAIGHLAMFWGKVSQHGSHGHVGDLPDAQLESWAGWDGKRGAFAAWLRANHLTDGVVNEYDEYSGALEAHRARTRERVKKWRTERERNAHGNDDVTRTVTVTEASRNDVTIRDDTRQYRKATDLAAPAAPARPPKGRSAGGGAKYPAFPEADCDALWSQWGSTFGAVEYSAFRKALGPHYQAATTPPSVAEMSEAIKAYREAVDEMDDREAGFQNVHKFAQRIPHWLNIGAMPYSTEWGELTERGRVLGSRAMREQQRAGLRQSA